MNRAVVVISLCLLAGCLGREASPPPSSRLYGSESPPQQVLAESLFKDDQAVIGK